ncbi:MAG: M20/M25/M40 family metallo-hydrolase [Candidatus Eisenbacteria bacterium]|nr:M20/M25/M40 family metallo-hydrolase [Candidatus Eisenbacteria bacterium]
MLRTAVLALALAPIAAPARAATPDGPLTPVERRMVQSIDRGTGAALQLLERVVDINSGTMHFDGVRDVAHVFAPEFEHLGFTTRWVDGASWGRAGHLIATRPGRPGRPRILLVGHLDTMFEPNSPFQRFERLSDSTARGPGVIDMKGGDVIMLLALRALKDAGSLDGLPVTVVLTGDEEHSGDPLALARADLIAAADEADAALGFEDGDGDPRHAVIARRGADQWLLRVRGTPAHSSQVFRADIGDGAIFTAAAILTAFRDSLGHEPYLTLNPGAIVGGTTVNLDREGNRGTAFGKSNVVAESTLVSGDLRTLAVEQRDHARAVMRRIVAATGPHTAATITFSDGYPPLAPSDGNRRLLALYDRASRDLGTGAIEPVDPSRAGAADISFTEGHVGMAIDGIGLRGDGGHTTGEYALLATLPVQAKRAALTIERLARDWRTTAKPPARPTP